MTTRSEFYDLYKTDYASIDGVEDVTYTPRNPSGSAVTGVKAKRDRISRRQAQFSPVSLESSDVSITLWTSTLDGNEPQNGDLITDAGGTDFIILDSSLEHWDTQYRCLCRREVS